MEKKVINPPNFPNWVKKMNPPFSPAVQAGSFIFVSGFPGFLNRDTEEDVVGIEAQTRETLDVMKDTLEAAGSSLEKVVKVNIYLTKAEFWGTVNEIYRTYFPKDPPARTTCVTELQPPTALIEIECIAMA